ncbi:ABC transporter, permease protein [Chitinispirillum alkaliphilum]|nr:ABC transporter, permease protein [Chitinispirillum alkaliphilum]
MNRKGNAPMHSIKLFLWEIQEFVFLSAHALGGVIKRPFYYKDLVEQMEYTGIGTLGITAMVSLFIGMALSLQIATEFSLLGLGMYTGRVVGIAIISEIGPVATALVFAGRAGSGMASELGSMVLKNQVDTMRVFGLDPVKKLLTPRIVSSLIMLPVLTFIGDMISLLGGYYIAVVVKNQSGNVYWDSIIQALDSRYVIAGSVKPLIFGLVIACISCYTGFSTKGGAVGLKSSTTKAFVLSTIMIIVLDFLITKTLLILFGYSV